VPDRLRGTPWVTIGRIALAVAGEDYDAAEAQLRARRREQGRADPTLAGLLLLRGKLAAAEEEVRDWAASAAKAGRTDEALRAVAQLAFIEVALRGRAREAAGMLDSALASSPLDAMSGADRPYLDLADAFAVAGRTQRSRKLLAAFDASADMKHRPLLQLVRHQVAGTIELVDGNYQRAIAEFRRGDREGCPVCALPGLGRAYDLSKQQDSAIAVYERYLAVPWESRVGMERRQEHFVQLTGPDDRYRAAILRRLGELYEGRGDREKAARYYAQFLELWEHCDPELRPQVDDVRTRLARISELDATRN
jgi:tetratricopeptide (TPR) repeat protein